MQRNKWHSGQRAEAGLWAPYRGFLQAVEQMVVLGFKAGAGLANKGLFLLGGLLIQRGQKAFYFICKQ